MKTNYVLLVWVFLSGMIAALGLGILFPGTDAVVAVTASDYRQGFTDGIANQAMWREHCDHNTPAPVDPPWLKRERQKAEAVPHNIFRGGPGIVNGGNGTVTVHGEVAPGGVTGGEKR